MKTTHKDLIVWQKSIILVKQIYQVTRSFPHEELMGISSQMRRAAISIPSNIAEGYGRATTRELLHFLYIALGSASEFWILKLFSVKSRALLLIWRSIKNSIN